MVDDVLLRQLPLPMGDRLVYLNGISPPPHRQPTRVSPAAVLEWQGGSRTLDALAAFSFVAPVVLTDAGAEQLNGAAVSAAFFDVLPVKTSAGRLLAAHDFISVARAPDDPGRAPGRFVPGVAVISHALWQRQFGGRADIAGHVIRLRQFGNVEVIGVLEGGLHFPALRSD